MIESAASIGSVTTPCDSLCTTKGFSSHQNGVRIFFLPGSDVDSKMVSNHQGMKIHFSAYYSVQGKGI